MHEWLALRVLSDCLLLLRHSGWPASRLGAAGRKARDLLTKRGLHPEVIAEARALLGKVGKVESSDASTSEVPSEREEMLERDLWNWYLEWSGIARIAISDRRLLRTLGFLRNSGGSSGDPETPEEPDTPAAE